MIPLLLAGLAGAADPPGGAPPQSLNPHIALIADVAAAWFSSDAPLQTGGHDPAVTGFNLQQLELYVTRPVDPYFRFDANIVFSLYGVEVEEVYATTLALPGRTQVRAGQFLTRVGRVNATHPHAWEFVDQPFPVGRVLGGEGSRGLGVEGSWLAPLPWPVEIYLSETMIGGESTARSWAGAAAVGVDGPLDLLTVATVEQFFALGPDWSVLWGLSWAGGPSGTGRRSRAEVYGTDLYVKYRPITRASHAEVTLTAEGFHRRRQVPGDLLLDESGFAQLSWRFARRWSTGARHEVGLPARATEGEVTVDPLDPEWTATRHRTSLAATWWPTEFSRLRLQGARDHAGWRDGPDWSVFLAFEFSVGAHGAHDF